MIIFNKANQHLYRVLICQAIFKPFLIDISIKPQKTSRDNTITVILLKFKVVETDVSIT